MSDASPNISTGVKSYDVSHETKVANVVADPSLASDELVKKLKKTGKTMTRAEKDGEEFDVSSITA